MIRVNLLPQKRGARNAAPQTSQRWLLAVLGVIVLEVVGLFLFHQRKIDELTDQQQKNQRLQGKIDGIKQLVANHEEIKKALAVLRAREDAIAKLQAARSGPTAVMLELAQLLTQGKGPTVDKERYAEIRKENPLAVYNPGWDSRRLWLQTYIESDKTVKIEGLGRDGSDVSEFAERLKLSVYFYNVTLLPGGRENLDKLEMVKFALQMKVRY